MPPKINYANKIQLGIIPHMIIDQTEDKNDKNDTDDTKDVETKEIIRHKIVSNMIQDRKNALMRDKN